MSQCVFCKIAAGEAPARIVYQNGRVTAFHDANPKAPVHILVIPNRHIERLDQAGETDEELLGHVLCVATQVARELELPSYRLVVNNGRGAGQSVPHLHFHLLGGRAMSWPPG